MNSVSVRQFLIKEVEVFSMLNKDLRVNVGLLELLLSELHSIEHSSINVLLFPFLPFFLPAVFQ